MILNSDASDIPLKGESVQCVITSPPYWGLRDYGTAKWVGGQEDCDHRVGRFETPVSDKQASNTGSAGHQARDVCPKCGAVREDNQLGLESTPEEYVASMVRIFREVRRVLRKDGVVWLNLGDSYAAGKMGGDDSGDNGRFAGPRIEPKQRKAPDGLKPKDLVGIPWRVAFALQADGWWLRSDIVWAKPNPMPESVTDRPTKAHEYVFLLTKAAKYFYDHEAVREEPQGYMRKGGAADWTAESGHTNGQGSTSFHQMNPNGRNLRSVWTIATEPFPEAHFATFPEKLVETCIKAGSRPGDIVFDPFGGGSGRVHKVAFRLGRRAVTAELSLDYCKMALAQRNGHHPLFVGVDTWTT